MRSCSIAWPPVEEEENAKKVELDVVERRRSSRLTSEGRRIVDHVKTSDTCCRPDQDGGSSLEVIGRKEDQ